MHMYIHLDVYIDTPPIDHLVMREFVSGLSRNRSAVRGVREQFCGFLCSKPTNCSRIPQIAKLCRVHRSQTLS